MINGIDQLKQEIAENTTIQQSVATLVTGMAEQLRQLAQNATDLEDLKRQVQEAANTLDANNAALQDVVTQNTPAPPAPPV